jgi:hypothetical protein
VLENDALQTNIPYQGAVFLSDTKPVPIDVTLKYESKRILNKWVFNKNVYNKNSKNKI